MNDEPKEIELKLRVAPEDIAVLRNHPRFPGALHDPTHEMLNSVYFDSDERFLRNHGLSLRVRHIGEKRIQTIKAADHCSGCFERSEWEQAIEGNLPDLTSVMDTALGPILNDDVRNALKPVFETQIERTTYHLSGNENDIVVAIDEGRIVANGSLSPVSEIEIELKRGHPSELFKIARAIGEIVPAQLDVKSKSERGYAWGSRFHVDWPRLFTSFARKRASNEEARRGKSASNARRVAQATRRHLTLFRRRERRQNRYDQA